MWLTLQLFLFDHETSDWPWNKLRKRRHNDAFKCSTWKLWDNSRVPFSILARQYNRAASILAGKNQNIISDPGKGDNLPRYVANESVNAPSYAVCQKRSVRHGTYYVCSASCIDFKTYDICAHTIAVAEMDCSLAEFFKCYKATNQGPPKVDALINIDLPTGRGSKKTKSTQRRRGAVNSNKKEKMLSNATRTHQNLYVRLQASIIAQWGTEETQMLKQKQKRDHRRTRKDLRYIYLYLVAEISLSVWSILENVKIVRE